MRGTFTMVLFTEWRKRDHERMVVVQRQLLPKIPLQDREHMAGRVQCAARNKGCLCTLQWLDDERMTVTAAFLARFCHFQVSTLSNQPTSSTEAGCCNSPTWFLLAAKAAIVYACCNHGCILYPDLADCKIEAVSKCTAYVQCHLKGKLQLGMGIEVFYLTDG